MLREEGLPSQNTARGAGFHVVCWPNLSLAMPPAGTELSERSWAWKNPWGPSSHVVATQKSIQRTNKPHPFQAAWFLALPGGAWLSTQPPVIHTSLLQASNSSGFTQPFLSLALIHKQELSAPGPKTWRSPYPTPIRVPQGSPHRCPPASGPVQSQPPSPRYPVAKLPTPAYHAISTEGQWLRVYCAELCLLTTFPPNSELGKGWG